MKDNADSHSDALTLRIIPRMCEIESTVCTDIEMVWICKSNSVLCVVVVVKGAFCMFNIYTYENKRKRERFSTLYSGSRSNYFPTNKSIPVLKTLGFVPINAITLSPDRYSIKATNKFHNYTCISIVMIY